MTRNLQLYSLQHVSTRAVHHQTKYNYKNCNNVRLNAVYLFHYISWVRTAVLCVASGSA